jgi:cell division protein FtsX
LAASVTARAVLAFGLACAAVAGAAASWLHARYTVSVAPITDGQPVTTSLVYDPQLLFLTMVLAIAAGVLMVLGVAALRRGRHQVPKGG